MASVVWNSVIGDKLGEFSHPNLRGWKMHRLALIAGGTQVVATIGDSIVTWSVPNSGVTHIGHESPL